MVRTQRQKYHQIKKDFCLLSPRRKKMEQKKKKIRVFVQHKSMDQASFKL